MIFTTEIKYFKLYIIFVQGRIDPRRRAELTRRSTLLEHNSNVHLYEKF